VRILTLTNCPLDPTLGSGKTVLMFTAGLRAAGHQVDVLEPADFEPPVWIDRGRQLRRAWWAWQKISRRVARGYDLVEFYGAEFWAVARHLGGARSRPLLVAHTNGLEPVAHERETAHRPLSPVRRWLDAVTYSRFSRIWLKSVDALVTLSEADRSWAVRHGLLPAERTVVVEPGVDPEYLEDRVSPASARGPRVAYSGSWIDRKGVSVLARVMDRVLAARPEVHFDVFGASRSPAERIRAAFSPAVRDRVVIHPSLSNRELADGLGRASVFVFPSRYEGYGIALAEALARGCAAVTTPTGLGADLADGEEARVVGFEDDAALERAVLQLLDDPALRDRLAANGRRRVRGQVWDAAGAQLNDVYESLVARRSPYRVAASVS
jgi:glycosyltransferase involved in cell wall biosynthesis